MWRVWQSTKTRFVPLNEEDVHYFVENEENINSKKMNGTEAT